MTLPAPVAEITSDFLAEVDRRLPGRLTGLFLHGSICWGEFFPGSDVDFVGLWDGLPSGADLDLLRAAHEATMCHFPAPVFDGFHCTSADLAGSPALIAHRPVFYESAFDAEGTIDINLVTWHELAERGIVVRGQLPAIRTDINELLDYTRTNLGTYWRGCITDIEKAGIEAVGEHDESVAWVGLGPARLHHLLTTSELTSKSGAGRYVRDILDARWNKIAREALRLRETPRSPSLYDDAGRRGRDVYDLLTWLVEDATAEGPRDPHRKVTSLTAVRGRPA
jgi:hypothetical protein